MNDNKIFFASLNLTKNPLVNPINSYITPSETDYIKNIKFGDLSSDVLDFIHSFPNRVSSMALFVYKNQGPDKTRPIYTDTHVSYENLPTISLEWHLKGPSCIEWYSRNNAKDRWKYKGLYPTTTYEYPEDPKPLAYWHGKNPALFNLTQPHRVAMAKDTDIRAGLSVRLKTQLPFDQLIINLKDYIQGINSD